jgi:type I restriction enzyme, R subunit
MDTSEKDLESTIEAALLAEGYEKRLSSAYDQQLCLLTGDVLDFIYATQPKEWARFKQQFNNNVDQAKERLFQRLTSELKARGTLVVLRQGIKTQGCHFTFAFFRPTTSLNPESQKLYEANIFSVVRQLHYSAKDSQLAANKNEKRKSLDLCLFLNGIPIFTAELKNDFSGQTVRDAMLQYAYRRDPGEPLLSYGRCLVHFAVDPDNVQMTTRLEGEKTTFLPFNLGRNQGAGNPPSLLGFATAYLWEQVWAKASVLELIRYFIHEIKDDSIAQGKKSSPPKLLFPRYHQLDAVRRLTADALARGAGQRYLIQHSAGSGKSNTIAWLAYRLSILHNAQDQPIFDSVIIISDRRVLDQQLQKTVKQFEQTLGVVESIDKDSKQLKTALESGKKIIITTLQKFPQIVNDISALTGKKFAVIIDEAHSSQSGEEVGSMKKVLTALSLEAAEVEEEKEEQEDTEDRVVETIKRRGKVANASFFAFTATPKNKTLELFGEHKGDDHYEPFSLYTMRQAIEERFILDVLDNYITYKAYWNLLKKIENDPRYERRKAQSLLRAYVERHEQTIAAKTELMLEHFHSQVAQQIGGRAKAMIVTASRLHAVRYAQQVKRSLEEKGYPYKVLVAFSGKVQDGSLIYDETGMNGGIPESRTAETFNKDEYRILIVANKFQTGFDQPLLHTMYVDKKLGGVNAVQTLSRLNRVYPGKEGTTVLDFANEAEHIRLSFQDYYEKTSLSQSTDPNLLYDLQTELSSFDFYTEDEVQHFSELYFDPKGTQDKLQAALAPIVERYTDALEQEQQDFRHKLNSYTRLYAFLVQLLSFEDPSLEKLYQFCRLLLRKLPPKRGESLEDIQQNIMLESYRLQQTSKGKVVLERGNYEIDPIVSKESYQTKQEELEPLSKIIEELNAHFGTNFTDEDKLCIREIEERLVDNSALEASIRVNPAENARLSFEHVVTDLLQGMVEGHFKFYKQVNDDEAFAKTFLDWLFERYVARTGGESREAPLG